MKEWLQQIISNLGLTLSWPDRFFWVALVDILLVYYLLYRGLLLLKGTKAVRMLLGLLLVVVSYFVSRQFGMQTFSFILDQFFNSFILVILIIFQDDLRRGLSRVGINIFTRGTRLSEEEMSGLDEMVKAAGVLSTKKIGALMVIERDADIRDHIQEGTPLDAVISEELLFSLFLPYSPLHDGAAVLHQGRIVRAGCFLPLTQNPEISKHLGTRHRAAIGLTESTDALVVVVSETDGKISLCRDGKISRGLDPSALYNEVLSALWPRAPQLGELLRPPHTEGKADEKKVATRAASDAPKLPVTTRVEAIKPAPATPTPTTNSNSNTRLKPFKPKQENKKSFQSEIRTTTSDSGKQTDTRLKPLMISEVTTWSTRSDDKKDAAEAARSEEPKRPEESPVPRQEERASEKSERSAESHKHAAPKEIVVKRIEMEEPVEEKATETDATKTAEKTAEVESTKAASAKKSSSEKADDTKRLSSEKADDTKKSSSEKADDTKKSGDAGKKDATSKKAGATHGSLDVVKANPKEGESEKKSEMKEDSDASKPAKISDAPTEILGQIPDRLDTSMGIDEDLPRSPYSSPAISNASNTQPKAEAEEDPSQDPTSPA